MGLRPIVLMSPFLVGLVAVILQINRENNSEIDKIYNTVIEEPYRNQQSENGREISLLEAESIKELQKLTHKLEYSSPFTYTPKKLDNYIRQQIKEAQGKDSAEGILVTKDEISIIKYNVKNKKKERRGKAVDDYKSFETTKLGAPISEAIKFQNIKNYSKNLLANAKLPNSNPIFNTKNLQKMIKR